MMMTQRRLIRLAGAALLVGGVFVGVFFIVRWSTTPPPAAVPTASEVWDPMGHGSLPKTIRISAIMGRLPGIVPTTAEEEEMITLVRDDPEFNIKVRAMAVLPFVQDRERAIDTLIAALNDRDANSSGSGNVPLYATTYLADMHATRAIPPIEAWLKYLDEQQPYDARIRPMLVKKGQEDLARLKAEPPAEDHSMRSLSVKKR